MYVCILFVNLGFDVVQHFKNSHMFSTTNLLKMQGVYKQWTGLHGMVD